MKCQSNFVRNLGSIGSHVQWGEILYGNIKVAKGIQLKKEIPIQNVHCRASFTLKSLGNILLQYFLKISQKSYVLEKVAILNFQIAKNIEFKLSVSHRTV